LCNLWENIGQLTVSVKFFVHFSMILYLENFKIFIGLPLPFWFKSFEMAVLRMKWRVNHLRLKAQYVYSCFIYCKYIWVEVFGDREAVWYHVPNILKVSIHNMSQGRSLGRLETLITIEMFCEWSFVNPIPINSLVCRILVL